jgi:hypothetical protein
VPLDEFLPHYDVREIHSTSIAAAPERVIEAALELTWRDVPLFATLMAVRSLPALLAGHRPSAAHPIVEDFRRAGFVALAERPDELIFGAVGQFWKPTGGLHVVAPAEFRDLEPPGSAKTVFNFRAEPGPNGSAAPSTRLTTETRVLAADASARRSFLRYWRVIHPGSALIRRVWLRAIRGRAARSG